MAAQLAGYPPGGGRGGSAVGTQPGRLSDWLLFVAFGAAALLAQRNIILIALIAPVAIASYLPQRNRPLPEIVEFAAGLLLLSGLAYGMATDRFFQLRAQEWKYPAGAVEFLRSQESNSGCSTAMNTAAT